MAYYWQLLYTRIKRWLVYIGINPTIAFIIMPILLFAFVKLMYAKTSYAAYLITLIYLVVVLPFSEKKRKNEIYFSKKNNNFSK